ncbi:MAG: hypothetical protein QW614_01700 [Candidatus Caldarchaeum sp.]|uniref:TFIIB-type zinc ribbon-containing protein n=1 Tax=Caldiarchaeum subterraneum TaxID=311458 RepID=A0A7C5Q6I1_CALS0
MKKKNVQVCPVCSRASLDLYLGGYLGKIYRCSSCGYVGAVIVEMDGEEYLAMLKELGEGQ